MEATRQEEFASAHWRDRVRLPAVDGQVPQHEESCEVVVDNGWRPLRFHDYQTIYGHPGLYEHLFYGMPQCDSPRRVVDLLKDVRRDLSGPPTAVQAIDLGAGNGIVGQQLRSAGAKHVVGIDIIPEAAAAASRDRPSVYDDYIVDNLCEPTADTMTRLGKLTPNVLACVAALGFGDIPPLAYFNAMTFLPRGGLVALNIKEEFLDERYAFGFSELVRRMVRGQVIRVEATRRYVHRLSTAGKPLHYLALVATKLDEVPRSMLIDP